MVSRAHPRFAVAIEIKLVVGKNDVVGRTENVSKGGLCAEFMRPVALGEGVVSRLALVFPEDEVSESIEIGGRVVWCTPIDRNFQVGIQFTNLNPEAARNLELFLRFLEARPT